MFQHFGNRLKRDLKQLVDRRLDSSALSSGSSMKVGLHFESKWKDELICILKVIWCRS
jgi:hypothetical protein